LKVIKIKNIYKKYYSSKHVYGCIYFIIYIFHPRNSTDKYDAFYLTNIFKASIFSNYKYLALVCKYYVCRVKIIELRGPL